MGESEYVLLYSATPEDIRWINQSLGNRQETDESAAEVYRLRQGRTQGPPLPAGFVPQSFDCPQGSDFDASRKSGGLCVDASGNPVTTPHPDQRYVYYHAVDGSSWPVEKITKLPEEQWIPGVPNAVTVFIGFLVAMKFLGRRS